MQRCPNCATENEEGRSFCTHCGAALWLPAGKLQQSAGGAVSFFLAVAGLGVGATLSMLLSLGTFFLAAQESKAKYVGAFLEFALLALTIVGLIVVIRAGAKKLSPPLFAFLLSGLIVMLGGFALCSALSLETFIPH